MRRRIFNILWVLSLVLWLATAVLWVRSYWVEDCIGKPLGNTSVLMESGDGVFRLDCTDIRNRPLRLLSFVRLSRPPDPNTHGRLQHGLDYYHYESPDGQRYVTTIWVPYWVFVLATGILILPVRRLSLYCRNRQRELKGLCLQCGYDLRASKERCPECGTAIAADAAAGSEAKAM